MPVCGCVCFEDALVCGFKRETNKKQVLVEGPLGNQGK